MRVRVDWYKAYGKWYTGTVVDIGDVSLVDSVRFKQAIVDNQGALVDSWVDDEFFVVVNNLPGDLENPDVKFAMVLFKPGAFAGMKPKRDRGDIKPIKFKTLEEEIMFRCETVGDFALTEDYAGAPVVVSFRNEDVCFDRESGTIAFFDADSVIIGGFDGRNEMFAFDVELFRTGGIKFVR